MSVPEKQVLEGKVFYRECLDLNFYESGDKKEIRRHKISFGGGLMYDNANTFFGNPPEFNLNFKIVESDQPNVFVICKDRKHTGEFTETDYMLHPNDSQGFDIYYNGILMNLEKSF